MKSGTVITNIFKILDPEPSGWSFKEGFIGPTQSMPTCGFDELIHHTFIGKVKLTLKSDLLLLYLQNLSVDAVIHHVSERQSQCLMLKNLEVSVGMPAPLLH